MGNSKLFFSPVYHVHQSKLAARKLKAVHISLHDILADDQTSDGDEVGLL